MKNLPEPPAPADPKQKPSATPTPAEPAETPPAAPADDETTADPAPDSAQAVPDELTDPGASRNDDAHPL